ncbi:hypothetical protein V1477_016457 [Vespula maculifrons]|uniref:Uncharacterized protein n=1 Tax=Vespula maculifrons TaxID=7453 RepID=A0ABD2B990_VESMC
MFLLNFGIHIQIRNKPKHVRMAPKSEMIRLRVIKRITIELQNVEDFADLFIKADLIEFISMETNIHRILIRVKILSFLHYFDNSSMPDNTD